MDVVAIAVMGCNRVIGDGETQPFKIREDWDRFKSTTMGHPLIMGRKTHDAIGRFLPGRASIIVSRTPEAVEVEEGSFAVSSVPMALALAEDLDEEVCYVIGGGEIYRLALDETDTVLLTEVDEAPAGSVTFPELDGFVETAREPREGYAFVTYERADRLDGSPGAG